jgi:hypothetical protein
MTERDKGSSRSWLEAETSENLPGFISLEDVCLDDFPPEVRAEIQATIEKAKALCQWLEAEAKAAAPEAERYRQASERLQRHLAIEAGRVPSPMQIEHFRRLDALLEALKPPPTPSPWQQEALDAVLEAFKSLSAPSPWQKEALERLETSLAALKRQPKSQPSQRPSPPQSESELGPQAIRAKASLMEAFQPDGRVPDDMSVQAAMRKARPHVEPDPKRGLPQWDAYDKAIKALGRAPPRTRVM